MPKHKLNARDHLLEVRDLSETTETWVQVDGLTNFVPNLSENEETAETTAFGDEGNYRQEKMQKGAALEIGAHRLVDADSGELDPAIVLIEDWHEKLGPESEGQIRFRHKNATQWTVWDATVTVGESGGEVNDKDKLEATFTRCGASRKVAVEGVTTP